MRKALLFIVAIIITIGLAWFWLAKGEIALLTASLPTVNRATITILHMAHENEPIAARTIELSGSDPEKLAMYWRRLNFGIQFSALCHFPIYRLQFFNGSSSVLDTTICWKCNNFTLPGNRGHMGFERNDDAVALRRVMEEVAPPLIDLDKVFNKEERVL